MNIQLTKPQPKVQVDKGDVLVFKAKTDGRLTHYLIIQDNPNRRFGLVNLGTNNLMSTITASTVESLYDRVVEIFKEKLTLVEVINHNDIVIKRNN